MTTFIHIVPLVAVVISAYAQSDIYTFDINRANENTLVLSHVLFRHGNRTVDGMQELYPNDPYLNETYHPFGLGQLTNVGKQKEFSIGTTLRQRYNEFLGEHYIPDMIEAFSTDYNRTKMSLLLVLAGLFPPTEEMKFQSNLIWQPIPYNYLPRDQDKVLLGVLCPNYLELYDKIIASSEMQEEFSRHKDVFDYISEHSGLNVNTFLDVYNLYFGISTEEEWGFELPEWTNIVWPDTIISLAIKNYFVSMATADMRKMATGYLLNKIIEDTRNKINNAQTSERKLYLYSGHENNIAELLMSLDVFDKPHVPNYGSYVLIEIHKINDIYGVQIFYENYNGNGPELLKMPFCDEFCPLEEFIALVAEHIPTDELCGI